MRKKCIAIAKKAMVWSLAAAMLVTTPLTASAAGLRDVYKVEDGWGDEVPSDSQDTRTGTVTSTTTRTNTGILGDESKLTGIVLSETEVQMELTGAYDAANQQRKELTVEFEGNLTADEKAQLSKYLTWKSGDLSVVALNNRVDGNGNKKDPNGVLNTMTLIAKAGGKTTVTVSLDDYENNIHFTTSANVYVKQYASDLNFKPELAADAYEGVSLDLDDYLVKTPETANDEITYAITAGDKYATLKNSVLKLKTKSKDQVVKVVALGEKTKSPAYEIKIKEANPAKKVEIVKANTTNPIKSYNWLVNDDNLEQKFYAKLTAKSTTINNGVCTDKVTWSSKKSDIVAVVGGKNVPADTQVTLVAKKVGKATITAQASSGKKGTLNVTVKANMTGFVIDVDTTQLYSGQTFKLSTEQYYGKNKDSKDHPNFTETALKWDFVDADGVTARDMKKVASVNSKGVLTIKPDLKGITTIKLSATNAKKIGKPGETGNAGAKTLTTDPVVFKLTQMDITSITVYSNMIGNTKIAGASSNNGTRVKTDKGVDQNIAVDRSRTYRVVATAKFDGVEADTFPGTDTPVATALSWVSSNEKFATAFGNSNGSGTVKAVKKGKPTISINGSAKVGNKYKAIKATFKANVTVPTKSIVLSTKNSGIAATNKNQTITVKATLDKGTTSKAKDIIWTAVRKQVDGTVTSVAAADIKNGKLKLKKDGGYVAGDEFIVTAKLVDAGVQSSIKLVVVKPTKTVQFVDASNAKITKLDKKVTDDTFTIQAMVQPKDGSFTKPGEDDVANVKYTVNKKGIVQIIGNKVTPIKKGKVTVTATTSDGKKGKLTINVIE